MTGSGSVAFSVIMPAHNAKAFIGRTLDTVAAQSLRPGELIIVDDGSTDETVAVVRDWIARHTEVSARLLTCPHRGPGATRNTAIREAQCEWVAFLDSDDLWSPIKLERVATAIHRHPDRNFFCHAEEHHRHDGTTSVLATARLYDPDRPLIPQLFRRNLFSPSAVVCRRQALIDAGLFDESLMSAQDYELWLRMAPAMRVEYLQEVLATYIDRPGNISSGPTRARRRNHLRILKRYRGSVSHWLYLKTVTMVYASFARNSLSVRVNQIFRNKA